MRISSRLALAGSVVVMLAAATVVALLMPGIGGEPVAVPELTASAEQRDAAPEGTGPQDTGPGPRGAGSRDAEPGTGPQGPAPQEPAPGEPTRPVAPPITGEQIAELAATPARERASTLIAEAEQERERRSTNDEDAWDELRDEIRDACDDGRINGAVCGDD